MSITIENPEIISFCESHPDFDLEKCLLFHINLIKDYIKADKQDTPLSIMTRLISQSMKIIEKSNENLKVSLEEKIAAMTTQTQKDQQLDMNEIIRTTFLGEDSISGLLVDSVKNTTNVILSEKMSELINGQQNTKDRLLSIDNTVSKVKGDLTNYLEKMKINRGIGTETKFHILLENALPSYVINRVPSKLQKGNMDIVILNEAKGTKILLDLKDYTRTIPATEVDKFEKDMILAGNDGVLLSPFSNISGKVNFQLSTIGGRIAIYLSNTGLDTADVVKAIQVIEHIKDLNLLKSGVTITDEVLSKISSSILSSERRLGNIKNHLKLAMQELDAEMFSEIKNALKLKSEAIFKCPVCGDESFVSARSLGAHKRFCK